MRESYISISVPSKISKDLYFFLGYFICPGTGRYADPIMFTQGKYFDCTNVNGGRNQTKKVISPLLTIVCLSSTTNWTKIMSSRTSLQCQPWSLYILKCTTSLDVLWTHFSLPACQFFFFHILIKWIDLFFFLRDEIYSPKTNPTFSDMIQTTYCMSNLIEECTCNIWDFSFWNYSSCTLFFCHESDLFNISEWSLKTLSALFLPLIMEAFFELILANSAFFHD